MRDPSDQAIRVFFAYYAGMALLFTAPALFILLVVSTGAAWAALTAACSCALVLTVCNISKVADALNGHRKGVVLPVALGVLSLSPLAVYAAFGLGAAETFAVEVAVGAILGVLFALLYLLWYSIGGILFTTSDDVHFRHVVLAPFGLSCVLMGVSALMQSWILPALCAVSLLVPSALYRPLLTACKRDASSESPSKEGPMMPAGHAAYPVVFGLLAGMTLFSSSSSIDPFACAGIVAASGILAFLGIYVAMRIVKHPLSFYGLERVAVPLAFSSALFAPLYGVSPVGVGVGLALCAAGVSVFLAAHSMLVMRWCHRVHPQPIRHFAYGSFTIAIGFAAGAAASGIAVLAGEWRPQAVGVSYIALMLALTVATSASPYNSIDDFGSRSLGGRPGGKVGTGIWETAVEVVANENGLTPREKEIAGLLARGRNTPYISKKLVISEHTTKTHIYHIYKKVRVSSAQAFIDLVEAEVNEIRDTMR